MPTHTEMISTTTTDYAAFMVARGGHLRSHDRNERGQICWNVEIYEPEAPLRLAFYEGNTHDVSIKEFIDAKKMFIYLLNHSK